MATDLLLDESAVAPLLLRFRLYIFTRHQASLVEATPTHFSTPVLPPLYRQFNLRRQGKSGKTINSWCKKEADVVNVYSVPTADTQLFHIL